MKSLKCVTLLSFALLTSFLSLRLSANVNQKNGNFYITYSDLVVPGTHNLQVVRTYNSRAFAIGWFGAGWGSDYETYLEVSSDGSVVVHENGAGALTRFTPRTSIDPVAAAKRVVDVMRKKAPMSESVANDMVKKLANDEDLRRQYSRKFEVQTDLADGTILYSSVRGIQELHKIKDGYKRVYSDGKVDFFNNIGRLTSVVEKSGYKIDIFYDKTFHVSAIKDSEAKQIFFEWHGNGFLKSVWSSDNKKTVYNYKDANLIYSKDVDNNEYIYDYDKNHNMTSITYPNDPKDPKDDTKMLIDYSKKQMVSKWTKTDGTITEYFYDSDPSNPELHFWTTVKKSIPGSQIVRTDRYEYEVKRRPDGSDYMYRIVNDLNGVKTETIYSECCGMPTRITRGKHVTTFDYDKDGLLLKKTSTKGEFVQLEYDKVFKKISKVVNNDGWTAYEYDSKGNLSKVDSDKGQSVVLIYDRNSRITRMVDFKKDTKVKRTLDFKYNALGKPVEISMDSIGKINVAYDNYGEIQKVESKDGHKMAFQVTEAFQSLLNLVKPAGVNLNM